MDLIAISYENIGPFYEKKLTVNFLSGEYLIKAPIGSGKSFLFFDGPLFALYKTSKRPLLSRKANLGYIHLLFEHDEVFWLIERQITPTKSGGDSVNSRLYRVNNLFPGEKVHEQLYELIKDDTKKLHENIIWEGVDIKVLLKKYLEEIVFTSQKELESSLLDLLPPKEVLQSVNFLSQDAINIFEMTAGERVSVFKHLFGLIGIDDAKIKIRDKRKEVQITLQVMGDVSKTNDVLQKLLQKSFSLKDKIEKKVFSGEIKSLLDSCINQGFFVDIDMLKKHVGIEHFQISIDRKLFNLLDKYLYERIAKENTLIGKIEAEKKQLKSLKKDFDILLEKDKKQKYEYTNLLKKIKGIDENILKKLKKEKKKFLQEQIFIEKKIDISTFHFSEKTCSTIVEASRLVEEMLVRGRQLKVYYENILLKIQHEKDKTKNYTERKSDIQKQLHLLNKNYEVQTLFRCDKISGACPYVEMIKGGSIRAIKEQKLQLENQLNVLNRKKSSGKEIIVLSKEKRQLEKSMKEIRDFLKKISRQQIQKNALDRENLEYQIKQLDLLLLEKEQEISQLDGWKKELLLLVEQEKGITRQIFEKKDKIQKKTQELLMLEKNKDSALLNTLERLRTNMISLLGFLDKISELVKEYKETQRELTLLKEKEGLLKSLYAIFSKELLLIVLQDFLPSLEEVMNSYLAQMVNYEVHFSLPSLAGKKIELQIDVIDDKGQRSVKSLSGGQKSVLKLAWILGVSSMMKGKFLFLDETINSMDISTIGKVADILSSFVKQKNLKFYVVTHSPQIQEMDIWKKTILLDSLGKNFT